MKPPAALEPPPELDTPIANSHRVPALDLDEQAHTRNYWWVWLLIFAAIGYGCYRLYNFENAKKAGMSAAKDTLKPHSIPVVAATARRGNMPVYLQGIGTVSAFNTVTVKPRIDGQLLSVNFQEGQFVNKGDILAQIDPKPFEVALDQAKGALAKDQAALKDAQVNYQRDQELFKDQIIARQQLETQGATADQFRGSLEGDQAAIDSAKLNLSYTDITAPISGRIGLRLVDAGNMIHAADANGLAVIAQMQPIAVLFNIPEDQLPPVLEKLRGGAKLRVEAFDRDMTKKLAEGTLLTVDNEIDQTTGTSRMKAVFPNGDFALFPNQFVNIKLWLDTKAGAIIVPAVAIQRGPTGTFVYLVQPDSIVTVRQVRVGMTVNNDVSVDEGLAPGDNVVVDGAEKLTDGMKVVVREPAPGNPAEARRDGA